MDWKEITLDDKEIFDRYISLAPIELSDYTFTNFFIWHFTRQTQFCETEDFLCIRITDPDRPPVALMPLGIGDLRAVLEKIIEDFHQRRIPFFMRAIGADRARAMEEAMPGRFIIAPEPDRFDYIYRVKDLIELDGKKFKDKRNHINVFKEKYHSSYHPLTAELLDEVCRAEIEWCKKRDCESQESLENEKMGILEAAKNFERLKFSGGLLRVEGRPVAFTFGEPLTHDMAVIHIEKAARCPGSLPDDQSAVSRTSVFAHDFRQPGGGPWHRRAAQGEDVVQPDSHGGKVHSWGKIADFIFFERFDNQGSNINCR